MKSIDILIPMSPERFLPQLVLDHILIQNIPFRLFSSNMIGDGAANARNFVKDMHSKSPNRSYYTLMTDNDILLPRGSLQAMMDFLEDNPEFGAVGLHRNEVPAEVREDSHINAGPVLFVTSIFDQITYHNNDGCECQGMTNDVRALDKKIAYLPNVQYEHIERTKRPDYEQPE